MIVENSIIGCTITCPNCNDESLECIFDSDTESLWVCQNYSCGYSEKR